MVSKRIMKGPKDPRTQGPRGPGKDEIPMSGISYINYNTLRFLLDVMLIVLFQKSSINRLPMQVSENQLTFI